MSQQTFERNSNKFLYIIFRYIDYDAYDVNNIGKSRVAGACTAAAFLREFVPKTTQWIHVDMAGVMGECTDQSYTNDKGMAGRPTRTLYEFVCRENEN